MSDNSSKEDRNYEDLFLGKFDEISPEDMKELQEVLDMSREKLRELAREVERWAKEPSKYSSDQFDALRKVKKLSDSKGVEYIAGVHYTPKLRFVDLIVKGDLLGLEGPVAFETKHVSEVYSLNYRLTDFLYKLEKSSSIRSVVFCIFDAAGKTKWEEAEEAVEPFRDRFKIRILKAQELTGKKVSPFAFIFFRSLSQNPDGLREAVLGRELIYDDFFKEKHRHEIRKALVQQHVVICVGAGVSASAGMPGWVSLIERLWSKDLRGRRPLTGCSNEDIMEELSKIVGDSPLLKARTLLRLAGPGFYDKLRNELYSSYVSESELLNALAYLIKESDGGVRCAITFNYDDLLEETLQKVGVESFTLFRDIQPLGESFQIHHVHGYLPRPNQPLSQEHERSIVFSEDSYHAQFETPYSWSNLSMLDVFSNYTCVFVGCSMTDPNMRRLLEVSQKRRPGLRHFALLQTTGYQIENAGLQIVRRRIMSLQEIVLKDLGIQIIWFEDFDEIPKHIYSWLVKGT